MKNKIIRHNVITRNIFNKIHLEQNKNLFSKSKVSNLISTKILNLKNNYFLNKVCADLGCGSTGLGALNLFNLGAKFVYLLDMNKHIIKPIKNNLKNFNNRYSIRIESIEKTSFKKNFFDFILCQGVMHSAYNDNKCFKEIYRVLRKKGKCLITVLGDGGIITDTLVQIIRPKYQQNTKFKKVIDKIIFNKLEDYKNFYLRNINYQDKKIINYLCKYIDQDFFLTLQDRILTPKYKTYDENELKKKLKLIGFKKIYRIKRKVKYNNLRRLLSPFYHHYNHDLSRLLYGNGIITLLMEK